MSSPEVREVLLARERLKGRIHRTPLERSGWLSELLGEEVYLKLECSQRTRSFKLRGAMNAVATLPPQQRARGLVTASAGNHGQAVALAASEWGCRATIFVPEAAAETKQARIRAFGAELQRVPGGYDEAEEEAWRFARETGAEFVHAFTDPEVVAGQGTVGLELAEDVPAVRQVVVPVGGGGLIAGVGRVMKAFFGSAVQVVGVQSDATPAMYEAFRAGRPVPTAMGATLADGLAGGVLEDSYRRARDVVDEVLLVPESTLAEAMRLLWQHEGVAAEGAAAVVVAAALGGRVHGSGPIVLVISGGNIDRERLGEILVGTK